MSESTEDRESPRTGKGSVRHSPIRRSKLGFVVLLLIAAYGLLAPSLNERFGLNLPALRPDSGDELTHHDGSDGATDWPVASGPPAADSTGTSRDVQRRATLPQSNSPQLSGNQLGKNPAGQSPTLSDQPIQSESRSAGNGGPEVDSQPIPGLLHGLLKETGPDRYLSPAGLLYGPGSQEGHRLEHLRRHTVDDPSRPGSHGVFDGDMPGALRTIDRAYQRAQTGQRTTTKEDDDRTIYTVDMGNRVGFVGGRDGSRRNRPMARRVRIVLEGNRFITAYPL